LTEIQAKLGNRTEFKVVPGVGGLKMDRLVRVSFQKPLGDVIRVRQKLGVESNKDVGAGTFDYYYKYECGKKR
jgi:hypothetical protein